MILFEGPDGSGKTTLARQISESMNIPIAKKAVSSEAQPMVDLRDWVDDNLNKGFHRVIYDRHRLISEPIYGLTLPHKRGADPDFWDTPWLRSSMNDLWELRPLVVLCLPSYQQVMDNIAGDENNQVVFDHMWAIYRGYQAFAASGHVDRIYDYTSSSAENDRRDIESRILVRFSMTREMRDKR